MYIGIPELYLITICLLEHYVFSRLLDLPQEQHTNESFFDMVDNLEVDCISEQEEEPLVPTSTFEKKEAEVSELDQEGLEFLSSLESEFAEPTMDEAYYNYSKYDIPPNYKEDGLTLEQEDCLSINDMNQSPEQSIAVKSDSFSELKTSKISENKQGEQQWLVTVIGKEDNYLHVTDGTRTWIQVDRKDAYRITLRDVLMVSVMKNEDKISVQSMLTIESHVSEDYIIPDEEHLITKEEIAI